MHAAFFMKLLLALDEMSPGGGPKFMMNLGRHLVAAGHDVTVWAERQGKWWPELAGLGVATDGPPLNPNDSLAHRAGQLAAAWNSQQFDVVFVNVSGFNRLAHCTCHLLSDDIAVVYLLHGDWRDLYDLAETDVRAWNCAVGVSPAVREGAAARFPAKPVIGIDNGIELPTEAERHARREWKLPLRLLFVGRLIDSHKGVFRLPAILAACRARGLPVTLSLIGDGPDRRRLARLFAKAGVSDLVTMMGMQPPSAIAAAMRDHHVFVFPTNTEGMPLVVLEAQANGCVPVSTLLPGITDVAIEDGVTGRLMALGDIEACVDHIADMLDRGAWQRHSDAAVARAERLFSLAAMGEQYETLVAALARGAHPISRPYHRSKSLSDVPFTWQDHLPRVVLRCLPIKTVREIRRRTNKAIRAIRRMKLFDRKRPSPG
jgi:glycosyltransferase involved in cell wall biosynthesis